MKVGVPRESRTTSTESPSTQAGVLEPTRLGHEVFIENDAGSWSSITNEEYPRRGCYQSCRLRTTYGRPAISSSR